MALAFPEENYRELFESAADACWVQDTEGRVVAANRACEDLTGYSRDELVGKDVGEFAPECGFPETVPHPKPERLAKEQVIRKDGSRRTVEIVASPVFLSGRLFGFLHAARDVTQQDSMAEMLSQITNGSPIPTFVIDRNHRVTHWNTALESISGLKASSMLGTRNQWQAFYRRKRPTLADLIIDGATDSEMSRHYPAKYKKSGLMEGAYEAEDFLPSPDSAGRWLHFTASPIKDASGRIIAALEALQDVTEEKRMQESMRFYVQLITRAQEEERKRLARELHDDLSSSLLLLIQKLDSAIARGRSRRNSATRTMLEELHSQAVEALEHVRRYVQDLRPRILDDLGLTASLDWMADDMQKKHGIKTTVSVKAVQRAVPVDVQLLLFRIAQEAFTNIRRHAGARNVTVTLEIEQERIMMKVTDDGKGFEVPSRVEDLAAAGHLGIMGMTERAKLLGGTLEVESYPGKGTSVVTRVPLPRVNDPEGKPNGTAAVI